MPTAPEIQKLTTVGNKSPFATPGVAPAPTHVPPPIRQQIVFAAQWCLAHVALFDYSQSPNRWDWAARPTFDASHRITTDCSGFVTLCHKWSGAPDPNGTSFHGGYTGTLLQHCQHIDLAHALAADPVVFGAGTGEHTQLLTEKTGTKIPAGLSGAGLDDWWCISHGHQGAPNRIRLSDSLSWFKAHGHPTLTILRVPGVQ